MKFVLKIAVVFSTILVTGILVGYLAFVLFLGSPGEGNRDIVVPDLQGLDLLEARKIVSRYGLLLEAKESYNDQFPRGTIFFQNPIPGTKIKEGRNIRVDVSAGKFKTSLPDLTGKTLIEAKNIIRNMSLSQNHGGLILLNKLTYIHDDQVPLNRIIAQSPPAGVTIERGTSVSLLVSSGTRTERFIMPDLTGVREADAREKLRFSGVLIKSVKRAVPNSLPDRVISQRPQPGEVLRPGQSIVLVVSEVFEDNREARYTVLPFVAPLDGRRHRLRVLVDDRVSRRDIFDGRVDSGERMDINIEYYPPGRFLIYLDGQLIREGKL